MKKYRDSAEIATEKLKETEAQLKSSEART